MSDYRVADGSDVALGSLTVLDPQPASIGIQYTRQGVSANGTVSNQGPYVIMVWSNLDSKTTYQSILSDFGLSSATSNDVTVYVRDENYDYARMNGTAIKPLPGNGIDWRMPFPRNLEILVRNLTAAS